MKKIEFIYPEFTNIYGEAYNVEYLKRCSDEIEVVMTEHREVPKFTGGGIDMVYIGCMTEDKQEKTISLLMEYREAIKAAIESGVIFFVTGNAVEIFGKRITGDGVISDEKKDIPALGIFDFESVRYMNRPRHNSQYIGKFEDMIMLGHRSQFSFSYGDFRENFIDIDTGIGMNPDTKKEGLHVNNFFATYSLGPYLILNPHFTKYLLRLMGLGDRLEYEDEIVEAYNYRLKELRSTLK